MFKENIEKDQVIARIKFLKDSIESYKRRIKNKPQFCNVAQLTKLIETGEGQVSSLEKRLVEIENQEKQLSLLDLVQEKEIEITSTEPIEIETIEPIEVEPMEPIKIEEPKRIKVKNSLVNAWTKEGRLESCSLKTKSLLRYTSDYDTIKLPNEKTKNLEWVKARNKDGRLTASQLSTLIADSFRKDIPSLYATISLGIEKEFDSYNLMAMGIGHKVEELIHQDLAKQLYKNNIAILGNFEFSKVFLTKNKQYIKYHVNLGSSLDAWGVMDGVKTIIEIKSTSSQNFSRIGSKLAVEKLSDIQWSEDSQKFFAKECPYYFWQIQAQLLTTGVSQAVVHIVNRDNMGTLTYLIKKDQVAFDFIERVVKKHEGILKEIEGLNKEEIIALEERRLLKKLESKEVKELLVKKVAEKLQDYDFSIFDGPYLNQESLERKKELKRIQEKQRELALSEPLLEKELLGYLNLERDFKDLKKAFKEKEEAFKSQCAIYKTLLPFKDKEHKVGNLIAYLDGKGSIKIKV